jgi:hypothetical protein
MIFSLPTGTFLGWSNAFDKGCSLDSTGIQNL